MSECMRTDILFQTNGIGKFLDEMEYHDTGNVLPPFTDEHITFISGFDGCQVAVDKLKSKFLDGSCSDGHQALLAAFSFYFDEAFFQIKVG